MPKGPQGQKRPADVIGAAVMVAKIATGEVSESPDRRDPDAVSRGRAGGGAGGRARADALSSERLQEIAQKAAQARWKR